MWGRETGVTTRDFPFAKLHQSQDTDTSHCMQQPPPMSWEGGGSCRRCRSEHASAAAHKSTTAATKPPACPAPPRPLHVLPPHNHIRLRPRRNRPQGAAPPPAPCRSARLRAPARARHTTHLIAFPSRTSCAITSRPNPALQSSMSARTRPMQLTTPTLLRSCAPKCWRRPAARALCCAVRV